MAWLSTMLVKDLRRRIRAPVGLIVLLIFPLAFASLIGVSFGPGSDDNPAVFQVKMLLVDHDEGFFSDFLINATHNEEFSKWFQVEELHDELEARRRMEDGQASALLIIPAQFSEDLLDEKQVELTLIKNPAQSLLPQMAEESVRVSAVIMDGGVRLVGKSLKKVGEAFQGDEDDEFQIPVDSLLTSLTLELAGKIRPMAHYLFPPAIQFAAVDEATVPLSVMMHAAAGDTVDDLAARAAALNKEKPEPGEDSGQGFNLFGFMLPMVSLLSILFLGENGMRDLLTEQTAGTLTRQFVSPMGVTRVLLAKVLSTLILCGAAMLILILAGLGLGWIPVKVNLPGTALQVAGIALAATGLATLIYGFVRTQRAASSVHSALVMGMSFLGGSFIPLQNMPASLQAVAPYTINYWGVQGLQTLTLYGGGLKQVLMPATVLLLTGSFGVLVGVRALARRHAAGRAA